MRVLLSLALVLGLAGGAGAQTAPAAEQPVEDKKICKRMADSQVGSNLRRGPSRVCKKASEWRAEQAGLQRDLDDLRGSGNAPQAGGPSPAAGPDPSGPQ